MVIAMEAWREELDRALLEGLDDSDDAIEEHVLEEVFLNLDYDQDEEVERVQVGGNRPRRRYHHRAQEEGHYIL